MLPAAFLCESLCILTFNSFLKCKFQFQNQSNKFSLAISETNFPGLCVLHWALIVKGVYHVLVSTVEPLQGADSKLLFSDQFCSSSHNGCCYD